MQNLGGQTKSIMVFSGVAYLNQETQNHDPNTRTDKSDKLSLVRIKDEKLKKNPNG